MSIPEHLLPTNTPPPPPAPQKPAPTAYVSPAAPTRVPLDAHTAATIKRGANFHLASIIVGLFSIVAIAPYLGAPVCWVLNRKAKEHGNPAYIGWVVFGMNCLAVVVMLLLALRLAYAPAPTLPLPTAP